MLLRFKHTHYIGLFLQTNVQMPLIGTLAHLWRYGAVVYWTFKSASCWIGSWNEKQVQHANPNPEKQENMPVGYLTFFQ